MSFDATCFYCTKDARLAELMLEITALEVSTLFLFREQTYRGRCLVAYRRHAKELFDAGEDLAAFARDIARAARAVDEAMKPSKINYGAYADKQCHLHFHIVPKYVDGHSWGSTFEMMPQPKVLLSDPEYAELIERIRAKLVSGSV
jgi:ATP adenylyltransferase